MGSPIELGPGFTVHVEAPQIPAVLAPPPPDVTVTVLPVAGPQGPQGPAGDVDQLSYVHEQTVPATLWQIQHNLGFRPSGVIVIEVGGEVVEYASVTWPSMMVMEVAFGSAIAGTAYIG